MSLFLHKALTEQLLEARHSAGTREAPACSEPRARAHSLQLMALPTAHPHFPDTAEAAACLQRSPTEQGGRHAHCPTPHAPLAGI